MCEEYNSSCGSGPLFPHSSAALSFIFGLRAVQQEAQGLKFRSSDLFFFLFLPYFSFKVLLLFGNLFKNMKMLKGKYKILYI